MESLPLANKPKRIQALQRGMAVLEAIAASPAGLRIQDLADRLGLTPGAIHHIVDTLAADGYLQRNTRPVAYTLGPALVALADQGRRRRIDAAIDAEMLSLAGRLRGANVVYGEANGVELRMLRQVDRQRGDRIEAVDSPLPHYTSAASLVHFAWWPTERAADVAAQRSFTVYGSALWGSRERFDAAVAQARSCGFADLPLDEAPRIGVPVLRADGALVGSLTLTARGEGCSTRDDLIREGCAATEHIRAHLLESP